MYKIVHFTNIALIVWLSLSIRTNLLFAQESPHPNVIIIYTDDQGTIDANCYGAKDLYSPNIDMLAKTGIKFTQFYVSRQMEIHIDTVPVHLLIRDNN